MIARPGRAAAGDLEGEHPAAGARPELAARDGVLRMAREAGVEDAAHAVLTLEPRGECRGVAARGARPGPPSVRMPAQHEERLERAERGARLDLDALDRGDRAVGPGDDAGDQVAVAAEELRRGLDDEVRAELERPADVRARERVVDDVRRAVAVGEVGQRGVVADEGRGVRDRLRVEDAGRARPRAPRRPRRGRSCRRCRRRRRSRRTSRATGSASSRRPRPARRSGRRRGPARRAPRGSRPSPTRVPRRPRRRRAPRRRPPSAAVVGLAIRL